MRPPGPPSPVQSRKSFFAASFAPSLQEAASVPARGTGRGGLPRTVQAPSTTTRVLTAVRGNPPARVATWGSARPPQEPEGVATPCKDHTLRKGVSWKGRSLQRCEVSRGGQLTHFIGSEIPGHRMVASLESRGPDQ